MKNNDGMDEKKIIHCLPKNKPPQSHIWCIINLCALTHTCHVNMVIES